MARDGDLGLPPFKPGQIFTRHLVLSPPRIPIHCTMASPRYSSAAFPSRSKRVLSNSAAEFVETRAVVGICRQTSTGPRTATDGDEDLEVALASVKFVPQLDVFMTKDEAPE